MSIETIIEDARWDEAGLSGVADTASNAVLTHLGLNPDRYEISLLGCDDARIAVLNADFRAKGQPTNVLSWPAEARNTRSGRHPAKPNDAELGDIAIAYQTCAREAADQGKAFSTHVTHLLVHGTLHLLGYDHIDDKDAGLMESLEVEILGKLGISDPYE